MTRRTRLLVAASAGIVLATAVVLRAEGRILWCACGALVPWAWDIWSRHNSQHLIDPYSPTHVLHGIGFYAILWAATRWWIPRDGRAVLAILLESGWEILENSEMVIRRYREATISLGYEGDSILNSISDIGMCALGFLIASRLPWKWTAGIFVLTEIVLLVWIRDSLIVNIVMLVFPIEALQRWQMAR
ncbi:MAG: DUF2585 family protein [Acidobacteriota bacterium]